MRKLWLGLAAMLLGLVATGAAGEAQTSNAVPPRLPLRLRSYFKEHPEAWRTPFPTPPAPAPRCC